MSLPKLMKKKEVMEYFGWTSPSTIDNKREKKGFPEPIKFSEKMVYWKESDIEAWIEENEKA